MQYDDLIIGVYYKEPEWHELTSPISETLRITVLFTGRMPSV